VLYYTSCDNCFRNKLNDNQLISALNNIVYYTFHIKSNQAGHGDILYSIPTTWLNQNYCVNNLAELFTNQVVQNSNKILFEWEKHNKTFKLTYWQFYIRVQKVAAALQSLNLQKGDKIGLLGPNSVEWCVVDYACRICGFVSVPICEGLGAQTTNYIIHHSAIKMLVCDEGNYNIMSQLSDIFANLCQSLIVALFENPTSQTLNSNIYSLDNLEKNNLDRKFHAVDLKASDLFCICYTSGTTSEPKGVMLSHRNFILRTLSSVSNMKQVQPVRYLSHLPFGHMFDRNTIGMTMESGGTIRISTGKQHILNEIELFKPTFLATVPRIWNIIHAELQSLVRSKSESEINEFSQEMKRRSDLLQLGKTFETENNMEIFNQMKAKMGGQLQVGSNGSAPINPQIIDFLKCSLNIKVCQSYGMTEVPISASTHQDWIPSVGLPKAWNFVKLVDVPEMNFFVTDEPHPRGEIWVKGDNIFQGYYKQPQLTSECFCDEWFQTGDIGTIQEDGSLKIIDRKKCIYKLAQGEYVRPEQIEFVMMKCLLIKQMFVYGDSFQRYVVALIYPNDEIFSQIEDDILTSETASDMILREITCISAEANLMRFEYIKAVAIISEGFTSENGMLTPSMKLKRNQILHKYKHVIDKLYSKLEKQN